MSEHNPGDFLLVDIPDDTGKLIRLGQWLNGDGFGRYVHVALYLGKQIAFGQDTGNDILAEMAPKVGARIASLSEYEPTRLLWSSGIINPTVAQRCAIVGNAYHYVEQRVGYSFLDYFALAAHRLHIPAPQLRTYIANNGHMICSQFVDQCYAEAGVKLFDDGRWQGYVTPGDLYQLLKEEQR